LMQLITILNKPKGQSRDGFSVT